jgi:hypothetical protein
MIFAMRATGVGVVQVSSAWSDGDDACGEVSVVRLLDLVPGTSALAVRCQPDSDLSIPLRIRPWETVKQIARTSIKQC